MRSLLLCFARMNPISRGHEKLVNIFQTESLKLRYSSSNLILSRSHDRSNPLSPMQKMKYFQKFFRWRALLATPEAPSLMHIVKGYASLYEEIVLVAGTDRSREYFNLIDRYNDVEYSLKNFDVVEVPRMDSDASASLMRDYAKAGLYKEFKDLCPSKASDRDCFDMYLDVREGMGLINTPSQEYEDALESKEGQA